MTDIRGLFDSLSGSLGVPLDGTALTQALPEVEVEGASEDGLVTVKMAGGVFTAVSVDSRALRDGSTGVETRVLEAVNSALAAHTAGVVEAMSMPDTDFGALQADLSRIGAQAQAAMRSHLDTLNDVLRQATERAERS